MKLYSIDVRIYGTVYIKAKSAAAARTKADKLKGNGLYVRSIHETSEVQTSELMYDDPNLPDVSLSPAMTLVGPDADSKIERVYHDVD